MLLYLIGRLYILRIDITDNNKKHNDNVKENEKHIPQTRGEKTNIVFNSQKRRELTSVQNFFLYISMILELNSMRNNLQKNQFTTIFISLKIDIWTYSLSITIQFKDLS